MAILIVLIAVVVIVAAIAVSTQRNLVNTDELCGNALSQIGVQQTSRWDALVNLSKMTQKYSDYEYQTLMSIVGERKNISPKSSASEVEEQEKLLQQVSGKLFALAEAYPDLKADQVYITTMDSVNDYENKVRMSRMTYNDTVTKFNRLVRQFPSMIFAGMFGFSVRDYLQTDEAKTEVPQM